MINKMFSDSNEVSSKRILGTTCILTFIGLTIGTFIGLDVSDNQVSLLNTLVVVGGALLGLGILKK